jgi:RNA polymerase sigma factor (sigma-70 family)
MSAVPRSTPPPAARRATVHAVQPTRGRAGARPRPTEAELAMWLRRGFAYARTLTRCDATAHDLLHDAMLGLLRHPGTDWTAAYVLAAIRNRHRDRRRAAANRRVVSLSVVRDPDDGAGIDPPDPRAAAPDGGPTAAWHQALDRAVAQLADSEREMLFLQAIEGFSGREIADLTGRPLPTVQSMIHRAKSRIREILGPRRDELGIPTAASRGRDR